MREGVEQALAGILPENSAPLTGGTLRTLCRAMFTYLAQMQDHCKPRWTGSWSRVEKAAQDVLHGFLLRWAATSAVRRAARGGESRDVALVVSWAISALPGGGAAGHGRSPDLDDAAPRRWRPC